MNIGVFCGAIGFGGSQNTTASIALELARRGHSVTLYIDKIRFRSFEDISSLEVVDIPWHLYSSPVWGYFSIRNAVHAVRQIQKNRCDVMLCVGPGQVPTAMLISAFFKIPCVYYALFPLMQLESRLFSGSIVANSEETRDSLARGYRIPADRISIIRARIAIENSTSVSTTNMNENRDNAGPKIAMMSRLDYGKTPGVLLAMEAVYTINKMGRKVCYDILGSGNNISKIQKRADRINADLGSSVISLRGSVHFVPGELSKYAVIMGIGRCASEAMACGKATIVVGNEGLGGIVCPDNIEPLMYHNFTARCNKKKPDPSEVVSALVSILDNREYRRTLENYSLKIVRENYDVKIGALQFEQVLHDAFSQKRPIKLKHIIFTIIGLVGLKIYHLVKCLAKWCIKPNQSIKAATLVRLLRKI